MISDSSTLAGVLSSPPMWLTDGHTYKRTSKQTPIPHNDDLDTLAVSCGPTIGLKIVYVDIQREVVITPARSE